MSGKRTKAKQRERKTAQKSGSPGFTLPLLCYLKQSKHQTGPNLWHKTAGGPLTILQQLCVHTQVVAVLSTDCHTKWKWQWSSWYVNIYLISEKHLYDLAVNGVIKWVATITDVQLNWARSTYTEPYKHTLISQKHMTGIINLLLKVSLSQAKLTIFH